MTEDKTTKKNAADAKEKAVQKRDEANRLVRSLQSAMQLGQHVAADLDSSGYQVALREILDQAGSQLANLSKKT